MVNVGPENWISEPVWPVMAKVNCAWLTVAQSTPPTTSVASSIFFIFQVPNFNTRIVHTHINLRTAAHELQLSVTIIIAEIGTDVCPILGPFGSLLGPEKCLTLMRIWHSLPVS